MTHICEEIMTMNSVISETQENIIKGMDVFMVPYSFQIIWSIHAFLEHCKCGKEKSDKF